MKRAVLTLTSLALVGAAAPSALAGTPDPSTNKKLGPKDTVGKYLGYPQPDPEWHGCTKTSSTENPRADRDGDGLPQYYPGNKQGAVTFSFDKHLPPIPAIAWKAKPGWKICGVQATVSLYSSKDPTTLLVGEISYPSGTTSGSTAKGDGRETLKVKIPKSARSLKGLTATPYEFYDVNVFVKKG